MKANGRLAYLHSSSINQKPSVRFYDHGQGCISILARTSHTSRLATREPAMSSTDFCDDLAIAIATCGRCWGLVGSIMQIAWGASGVLGQDVAPLHNASVHWSSRPLPVSGMSSNTDTKPTVARAARPKKATALPNWS